MSTLPPLQHYQVMQQRWPHVLIEIAAYIIVICIVVVRVMMLLKPAAAISVHAVPGIIAVPPISARAILLHVPRAAAIPALCHRQPSCYERRSYQEK